MSKLIVGNWKMNQTQQQVKDFFLSATEVKLRHEAWVAPQTLHLSLALACAGGIRVGAQNCSQHKDGAFTGENSAAALKDLGAHFTLVGHSERRQIFGESDEVCLAKNLRALSHGLVVIYCVGETLDEREAGRTLEVVHRQLKEGMRGLEFTAQTFMIAYEPVWAIGTGKVATPAQAQEVHAAIRAEVGGLKILYGGSVKPDNASELLKQQDIDGALVGGSSLKAADFIALCQAPV